MRLAVILVGLLAVAGCGGGGSEVQNFALCGNNRLDGGERCDDGNLSDGDACTSACQPATCNDGVRQVGVEDCDQRDLGIGGCEAFGLVGTLACAADCRFDLSGCSQPSPSPTPLPPTATPTTTPTPRTMSCGDGLLSPDETCVTCAADCQPQPCAAGGAPANVTISLALPSQATRVDLQLAYRTSVLTLPAPLTGRVRSLANPVVPLRATDTGDYRLDILAQSTAIQAGAFASVQFERCGGAAAPEMDDFACVVTACRSGAETLTGCTCTAAP